MKKAAILAAIVAVVSAMAIPAPASAQSFSLSFGSGDGPRYHRYYDHRPNWHRPRGGVEIGIGPFRFRAQANIGHYQRCEARFRSYDRASDTYLGFDGDRHRCRL